MLTKTLTIALALVALTGDVATAQEPPPETPAVEEGLTRRERARRRWEAMEPDERALFLERLERLRTMLPEERTMLEARAQELERRKRELVERLTPEVKSQFTALDPERREELLRQFFDECERLRGMRLREHVPAEFLEELEAVPPDQRRELMRDYQRRMRAEAGRRLLDQVRDGIDVPPGELNELDGLGDRERRMALLELKREHIRMKVRTRGLPGGIDEAEWAELDALSLEEFFERWRYRRKGEEVPSETAAPTLEEDRRPRAERRPPGPPRGPHGRPPHRGEDHAERRLREELVRLAHPRFEDMLDHSELPRHERREAVAAEVKARCLEFLSEHPLLPAEEVEELGALSGREFMLELRNRIAPPPGPPWRRPPRPGHELR